MTHLAVFVALIIAAYIGLIIIGTMVHLRSRHFNWSVIGICGVYAGVFGLLATALAWLLLKVYDIIVWLLAAAVEWLSR